MKLKISYLPVAFVVFIFLFAVGSFFIANRDFKGKNTVMDTDVDIEEDLSFSSIKDELIQDEPEKSQKTFEVERLITEKKQERQTAATKDEIVIRLQARVDSLTMLYKNLQKQVDRQGKTARTTKRRTSAKSSQQVSANTNTIDFAKYFQNREVTTTLTATDTEVENSTWVKLRLDDSQRVYGNSIVTFTTVKDITLNSASIAAGSKLEGVCNSPDSDRPRHESREAATW